MFDITITGKIALFVALPTTFVLLYLLLRRTDVRQRILRRWNLTMDRFLSVGQKLKKDDEEDDTTTKTRSSRQSVIELKVPSYAVSAVIGEEGTTIKKIEKNSQARIEYKENADRSKEEEKTLSIQGHRKAVQKAEFMIRSIIADVPIISSEDMYVPNSCTTFLLGKNAGTLQMIRRISGAEVVLDRVNIRDPTYMRLVTLTGTREQNELAKKMINEKIDEFETFQTTSDSVQESEIPLDEALKETTETSDVREKWDNEGELELPPMGIQRRDVLELMVISAENPGHFWGHICNENLPKLFQLQNELEAFYGKSTESEACRISQAAKNDIVAVCLDNGTKWFRARITEVLDDGYQVFCVDYGYHEVVSKCDIRKLCGSFLSLPFQALECYLANVKPTENENWSKFATDVFENLVCMKQSKVISGDVIRYQRTSHGLVPCLKLIDYNGPQGTVNINEELVQMGHAEWNEASESEQMFKDDFNAEMSQKVLTREGSGSIESLTDPFLKFPPEEKQKVSSPPTDAEWADDFPYAWAYNEEESTARGDVCEMQPCLSDKHSPIGEITQAGAGDIISLQETNTFTKQTSESSYLTTTGYDEENHALKTDDTKDLSGSLFYNGICSDVDKGLPASPNSPPICHPDGYSVGVPESNLYSFSAENMYIDRKENILTRTDDNSSLSICQVDSEMTQISDIDTVADQQGWSISNSEISLDRTDITRLGSQQDDSGIFCSSIAVSAKTDDSTSEFTSMDISREENSSAITSQQEDHMTDLPAVMVLGRDESALENLKKSGDSMSISQDTSTLICESQELDENELNGRVGLYKNMGTKEDKEEGKEYTIVSGRDPNVFIDINRSGENLEQEQTLPCSPQPHLGEQEQFSSENLKILKVSEQSTNQLFPETEATVSGSAQISSTTDLSTNNTPFIVQSTRSQSEEHDQCVLDTTDINTKTCDLKTDTIKLSDVTTELMTQTVPDVSETFTHDYHYMSETESHKADDLSEITNTESCEKLKESGFFSVVPGPCLNDKSSSTLDYSQTEPLALLIPSTTTDISPSPCPTNLDPLQTIPLPSTNILDQPVSNVELASSLDSATEVCAVLQEIDDFHLTSDAHTQLAEKEINLIQVEEVLSSDSQRELSPKVFEQATVLTVTDSKETDSSQCQFVQSLPSVNRKLIDKWAMLYSPLEEDDDWKEKKKLTSGQTNQCPILKTEPFFKSLETVSEPLENDTHTDNIWKFFYTPVSDKERESKDARGVSEEAEYSKYGYDEHKSCETHSNKTLLKDQSVFHDNWKFTLSEPLEDDETDFYMCSLFESTISERKVVLSSTDERQIIYSSEKHIQVVESIKYEKDEDVREIEEDVVREGEKPSMDERYDRVVDEVEEEGRLSDSPEYEGRTEEKLKKEEIKEVSIDCTREQTETSSQKSEVGPFMESKSVPVSALEEKQNGDLEYSVLEDDEWEEGDRTVIKCNEKPQDMKTFQKDWHCTRSDPLEEETEADWLSFYSPVCEDSDMIETESLPDVGEKQDSIQYSALEEDDEWEEGERPKVKCSKEMASMKTFQENWKETASDPLEEEVEALPDSADRSLVEPKTVPATLESEKQAIDMEYSTLEDDEWEEGERTEVKTLGETSLTGKTFQENWKDTKSESLEEGMDDWLSFYSPVCEDPDSIDPESLPDVDEKQRLVKYSGLEEDEWEEGERPKVSYSKEMASVKTFQENWKETASDSFEEEVEVLPDSADKTLIKPKTLPSTTECEKQVTDTEYSTLEDDEWEEGERTGVKTPVTDFSSGKTFQENWKDTKSESLEEGMGDWLSFYSPVSEDPDIVDTESLPDTEAQQGLVKYSGLEEDEWEEGERPKIQSNKEEISIESSQKHWKETVSDPLEEECDWLSFYSSNTEDTPLVQSELVKDTLTTEKVEELPDVKQEDLSKDEEICKDLTSKKDTVTDTGEEEDWLSYHSAQSTDDDAEMVDAESQLDSTEKSASVPVSAPGEKQNGDLEYSVLEDDEWEEGDRTVIKCNEKPQDMKTFQKDWHCTRSDPLEEETEADWLSFYSPVCEDSDMIETESLPDVGEKQDSIQYSALEEDDEWEEGERPKVKCSKEMASMKTFQENWKETASDPLEEEVEALPDSADRSLVEPKTVPATLESEKQAIDMEYSTLEDDEWEEGERTEVKTLGETSLTGKTFQENWKDTKSESLEEGMDDWLSFYSPVCEDPDSIDPESLPDVDEKQRLVKYSGLEEDEWEEGERPKVSYSKEMASVKTFQENWKETASDSFEEEVEVLPDSADKTLIKPKTLPSTTECEKQVTDTEYSTLEDDEWEEGERTGVKTLGETSLMGKTFQENWKDTKSDSLEEEMGDWISFYSPVSEYLHVSELNAVSDTSLTEVGIIEYSNFDDNNDDWDEGDTPVGKSEPTICLSMETFQQNWKETVSDPLDEETTEFSLVTNNQFEGTLSSRLDEKPLISRADSKDETLHSSSEGDYPDDKSKDIKEKPLISGRDSNDITLHLSSEGDYPDDKFEDQKEPASLGDLVSISQQDGEGSAEELPHIHYQKSSSIEDSMSESDGSFEGQEYEGSDEMLSDSEHLSSEDDETPIVDLTELTMVSSQTEPGYSSSKSDYMSEESEEEDYDDDNFTASDSQSSGEEYFPETGLVECDEEHQVSEDSDQEVATPSSPKSEFSLDEVKPCQKTELPVAESETILSDQSEQSEDEESPSEQEDEEGGGKEVLDMEGISSSSLEIKTKEADDDDNLGNGSCKDMEPICDVPRDSQSSSISLPESETLKTLDVSKIGIVPCEEIQHETKNEEILKDQFISVLEETRISQEETRVEDTELISVDRSRSQSSSRSCADEEQSACVHISQPDTDLPEDFENVSQSGEFQTADLDRATSKDSCEKEGFKQEESTIKQDKNEFKRDEDTTKVEQELTTTVEKNFQEGWKETQSDPLEEEEEASWLSFYSPGTEDVDLVESVSETNETLDAWSVYPTQCEEILEDNSDKEDLEFVDAVEEQTDLWYPALSTFSLDSYDEKYERSVNIIETDEDTGIYVDDNEDGCTKAKSLILDDLKVCTDTFLADWKETVSDPLEEGPGYSGIEWRSNVVTDVKGEHYEHPSNYSSLYEDSEWEEKVLISHHPISKQVEVKMFEPNWKETVSDPLDEDEDSSFDFLQCEDGKYYKKEQPEVVLNMDEEQTIGSELQKDNQLFDECQSESSLNEEFDECRVSDETLSESREGGITTEESADILEALEMSALDTDTKRTTDSKDLFVAEKRIQVVEAITYTKSTEKELDIDLQYSPVEEDEWEERDENVVQVPVYSEILAETFKENWKETESDPLEVELLPFISFGKEVKDIKDTESITYVSDKQDSIQYSGLEEDEWEEGERPKVSYSKEMASVKTFQENWKETASDSFEEEVEVLPDSADKTLIKPKTLPSTTECEKQVTDTEYSTLEDDEWEEGERTGVKTPMTDFSSGKTFQENWKDTKSESLEEGMGDWLSFYSPVSEDPDIVDTESLPDTEAQQGLVKYSGLEEDEWEEGERPKIQSNKEEISIESSQKHWKETVSDPLEEECDWLSFYSPNTEDTPLVQSELVKDTLTTEKVEELPDVKQEDLSKDEEICKDLTSKKDTVTDTGEEEDWLSYYSAQSTDDDAEMVDAESQLDSTEKSASVPVSAPGEKQNGDLEYSVLEDDEWEEGDRTVIKCNEKPQDMKMFQKDWHCTRSDPLEEETEADWLSFYSPVCEDSDMIETESLPDVGEKQDSIQYSALEEDDEWEEGERPKVKCSKEMASMKTFQENWKETASDPLEEEVETLPDSADRSLVEPKTVPATLEFEKQAIDMEYSTLEDDEWEEGERTEVKTLGETSLTGKTFQENWKDTKSESLEEGMDDWLSFYSPVCEDPDSIDPESLPDVDEKQRLVKYSGLEEDEWEEGERPKVSYSKEMASVKTFQENWKETASDSFEEEVEVLPDSADKTLIKPKTLPSTTECEKQVTDTKYSTLEDDEWEEGERTGVKTPVTDFSSGKTFQENWKDTKSESLEEGMGDWLSFYSPVSEDPDIVDTESLPDTEAQQGLVKYSGLEEDEWEEGERPKIQSNKEEISIESSQKDQSEIVSETIEPDFCTLSSPESTVFSSEIIISDTLCDVQPLSTGYSIDQDENVCDILVEETSSASKAVNTDDKDVWGMYFTSLDEDDDEWNERNEEFSSGISKSVDRSEDFSWEVREQIAQSLARQSKSASYQSQPKFFSSSLESWVSSGTGTLVTATPGDISTPAFSEDDDNEYMDAQDSFQDEEVSEETYPHDTDSFQRKEEKVSQETDSHDTDGKEEKVSQETDSHDTDSFQGEEKVSQETDPHDMDSFHGEEKISQETDPHDMDSFHGEEKVSQETDPHDMDSFHGEEEKVSQETDPHDVAIEQNLSNDSAVKCDMTTSADPEALARRQFIEEEISLLLCEIVAMATEETKSTEKRKLSEQDIKEESSKISQQITELIHGMVNSNEGVEKSSEEYKGPQVLNVAAHDVDEMATFTEVVPQEETYSDELVLTPRESEVKSCNLHVTQQMEEKLQNIATLYSNYAEEIPDTQLMLKLETLYFIEKLGKNKQKPSPPENLPSLEATSAAGTGIAGPSVGAVESNESLDSHSRSAVPEIPPDTNEQLNLGQVETASKSPMSENDEIFANVLMVELPSAEELSVSEEVSSFDASVHECETQRFTSILEVSLPEGPTNENRELTPCKIVPDSKKLKLKKKRLSPGDRIARRWRKKSPYRNYSNALFVNIPSFEESSNVEFWKKMSRTCVEPNSDLEDFQKGKKMIQRRISEAGFPIETQSELLLRIPPHESDTCWKSKFRCSLHTFVSDYDQKHFHNVFVIPKRHEKYSAEVNMDLNRRILAGGTKKELEYSVIESEDNAERACSPDSKTCALSSSCASRNENVTQRKPSVQEKTTIILHDNVETKEKESERKNSVVIDFATSDDSNDKMSYFTEEQIQDLLRKITQEASVSHYSKTAIYNDSYNFENNYRYGTNGSHLGLMDYTSSGEIYYDAKSEPDKTMLSTYSEMLLSSNIVSPETVEEETEPDSQVRAGSTDSEGYMTAEEKSESELQMTQTSERLAIDLSSLLSVDSAELSRELSQSYACDQPNFTKEQSISTSSSDSDIDYPASQHLILDIGLEKESRTSEASDPSNQLDIGAAISELSITEVEPRSEPTLEPTSSFVEPVSTEVKSSNEHTLETMSLDADSFKPKEIPTIHTTEAEDESQDKVCKDDHSKEKTVMEVSLFGEKHMVSSTDELKVLVESHDLNIEDFSSIKLSPGSQLDCFSELSFGGVSSVDLDELLHQKNLILEVQTPHEGSSSQKEKQKESVSSCVDRTEEFSLIDLPQQIEKSISEYCLQSRKSLTDGTCLPLPDGFPFGIGKPDNEQQALGEGKRSAESEMVVTGSDFDLPIAEDSEDKAEIIKDSTLAAIVDNVLFESEDNREETDSKISSSVKDEDESDGTLFAALDKGKKKKKKRSKFFALDNEVLMSFRDGVDVTRTEEEEETRSIDKAQMLFEQVDDSSMVYDDEVKNEKSASKLSEMQDTSSKDNQQTNNIYHSEMKESEIYEFKTIDIPENSILEANRVLIDSKELDKTKAESGKNFLVDQIEVSLSDQAILMTSKLELTQEIAEMNINQGSVLAKTEIKPYEDTQVDQIELSLSEQPTLFVASDLGLTEENAEMSMNKEPVVAEVTSHENSQVDQIELSISAEAHPITSELELAQETAKININQGSNLAETESKQYENSQVDQIELPLSDQALLMTSDLGLTHETAEMNINQGSVLAKTEVKPYEDTQVDQVELSLSDQPTLFVASDLGLTEENAEMSMNKEPVVAEVTSHENSQVDQIELSISAEAHPITSELELAQETAEININQGSNLAETEVKSHENSRVDQIELPLSDQALLMTSDLGLTHETAEMNINQGSVLAKTEVKPYEDTQVDQVELSLSEQPTLFVASDLGLTEENVEMSMNKEPVVAEVTSHENSQVDQIELSISAEAHPITSELELAQETAEIHINQGSNLAETEVKSHENSRVDQIELPLSDQALLMTSDLGLTHETAEMNINHGSVLAETEIKSCEKSQVDQIEVSLSDQVLLMTSELESAKEESIEYKTERHVLCETETHITTSMISPPDDLPTKSNNLFPNQCQESQEMQSTLSTKSFDLSSDNTVNIKPFYTQDDYTAFEQKTVAQPAKPVLLSSADESDQKKLTNKNMPNQTDTDTTAVEPAQRFKSTSTGHDQLLISQKTESINVSETSSTLQPTIEGHAESIADDKVKKKKKKKKSPFLYGNSEESIRSPHFREYVITDSDNEGGNKNSVERDIINTESRLQTMPECSEICLPEAPKDVTEVTADKNMTDFTTVDKNAIEMADITPVDKKATTAIDISDCVTDTTSVKDTTDVTPIDKDLVKMADAAPVDKDMTDITLADKDAIKMPDVTSINKEVTDVTSIDKEVTDVTTVNKDETKTSKDALAEKTKKSKKEVKESSKKKDSSEKRKRSRSSKSAEKEIYKERSKSPKVGDTKQTSLKESVDAPLAETTKDSVKSVVTAMELSGKDSKKKKKRKKSSLRESPETSKSKSEKDRQTTPSKTLPTSEQSVSEEIAPIEKSSEMVRTKKEIVESKMTRSEESHSSFLFETTYPLVDRQPSSEEELQREFSLEPSDDRTDESIYNLLPSETEIDVRTDKASIQEELKGEFTTEEIPGTKMEDAVLDPSLQEKDKVAKVVEKKREASVKKALVSKTTSTESSTSSVKTSTIVAEKMVPTKSEIETPTPLSIKTKHSEASMPSKNKSRDAKTKSAERKKKTERLEKINTQPSSVELLVEMPAAFAEETKSQNIEQQQQPPLDEAVKKVPSYQRESSLSTSESPRTKVKQTEQKKKRRRSPFPYGDGNKSLLSRGIEEFFQSEDGISKSVDPEKSSPCPARMKTDGIPEPFVSVEPMHLVETTNLGNVPKKDHQSQVVTTKVSKDKSHKKAQEETGTKKPFEDLVGNLPKEECQPQVVTTKITKDKSHKKAQAQEEEVVKKSVESMAGNLPKEDHQPQVVTTKISKDKSHKKVQDEKVTKKPFDDLAGDLPKEECQPKVITTKVSKDKSYKNVKEEEATKKPAEGLDGNVLKEDHHPLVITTKISSKEKSLKNVPEEEVTKKPVEDLAEDLPQEEDQPQVVTITVPKEKSHKNVQEKKEAIFNVPSPCSYVVKDTCTETPTKEVNSKTEKETSLSTKISESRVSQALSKVSSLISKKTSLASENGSPKHKGTGSSSDENINSSPPLSQASDSSSSLNLGLLRLSTKKKQKKVDSVESLTVSEKTSTKTFTADSQETSESSREDLSTKILLTPMKEVSSPDSLSETVLDSPVKKEKPEVPKITKSVVEKISSLVTSITKQVTESLEELSTHKKKKLKQSIISEKEAQERQVANEELGKTLKQKLNSKTKSNKSSSEDRSKSRTRSKGVFAGSQLLSVQQSARKTPSPLVSRKKGQKQQQQSSTRRDRQNIPFSTITIESPHREHTYLPLINHLTEEEAAFSDTTPQIKRKKKKKRKERNLSQLSTATESSCEIDTVLWSSFHKRSTQDLSVKKKTRITQPRITISEDRDYWQSSAVNSPDVIKREVNPIQYLSSDNLSHTRSRSRSHRSPAKELLWLSEQELTLSDGHETNTTRRVRSQSHIHRFSKINLAYISTGTRKRKRRKKNIVAV